MGPLLRSGRIWPPLARSIWHGADARFLGLQHLRQRVPDRRIAQLQGRNVDKLKPFKDFDPANGKWGAVELAARYDQLDLTDPSLALPTSPTNSNQGGRKAHT
jgi:hypothetical protein